MSDACIPQDPHDRARLARQSYARMRARMLSLRVRPAGHPAPPAPDPKGGGAPIRQPNEPAEAITIPERSES